MNDFKPNLQLTTDAESNKFPSVEALRTFHSNLLKLYKESGNEPDILIEIEQFVRKGRATGAILTREDERWSVQSLLDYWSALLYRAGLEPPDATLVDCELPLASETSDASLATQITQSVTGDQNQVIGQVFGGEIIAKVENLIQNFHLSPQAIFSLDSFWQNWSQDTNPPLSPILVIGGREQERDRIISWLRGSPSALSLQADSPGEAITFLAAVIQGLDEEERNVVLSRAIVVDGATAWQSLITSSEPCILVPRLDQPEGIGQAIKNGHHIFVPLGRLGANDNSLLPRIVRDAAEQSLKEMGLSDDRARNLATLARRSLSALRRKLAIARNIQQPAWAQANHARDLLAPLLASAWDDSCRGDREALAQLSGMPYEHLQTILVRWANEPDPPVRRVGDIWMIAAQEDAWRLIARYLTNDDLQRFENVAIDILSELDPAFELPPEQRYATRILTRSGRLRGSIAETLALMATLSSEIQFMANRTGEDVANSIIWQLMKKAENNERLWASLAPQLPLLAEAAPSIVIDAIHAGLTGENPTLVSLFQDKTSNAAFLSSSPHTNLLWALETLAWCPDYLSPAALGVARLARLDPGGRFANRPAKSLRDIFICWCPHTTASLKSRLNVLDNIRKQEPGVAWQLLMSLLPQHHSVVVPTHGTKWRDWVPDAPIKVTVQEYVEATDAILQRLISDAGTNITRWCSLIDAMAGMTDEQQKTLIQALEVLDPEQFSSKEQAEICNCLRREIIRHQDFPDADWAMSVEHVQRLEEIFPRFEPNDLVDRYCWLFEYSVPFPGMHNRPWNERKWEEREKVIGDLRANALQKILEGGWNRILELSEQVKEPSLVGETLAKAELLPIGISSFLEDNLGALEAWRSQMVQRFVTVNAYKQGEPWIEACINANSERWTSEQYGEFLLCLPFNAILLDQLDTAAEEVQRYFWSRTQAGILPEAVQLERVLTQLLKFQRPHSAVDMIEWAVKQTPGIISPERIAEILEVAIQTPPEPNFDASNFAYHSSELLNYLETTEIPHDSLANLEWLYLRIHEHYRRPNILYRELSKNPVLFIEALQCIFPAENEPPAEVSDNIRAFALLALDFLESWQQMPGVQADGSVDAEALRAWVMRARELAAECGRGDIADTYIGHVLAFSPIDPDGMWPHQAVRDLIEELQNLEIEDGWQIQKLNNRGVTVRLPTDGGNQERILVEKYESHAKQMADQWPRTAAVLRKLANSYRRDATQQDQQAELTQDFWQ